MMRKLTFCLLLSLLLIGCSERDASLPADVVTDEFVNSFNVATASGKVLPVHRATMSFEVGGRLESVVAEGSQVAAGEVIARLESSDLDQAVAQAQAALETARAQLALAEAEARPADLIAAEGMVLVAEGNLLAATGALAQAQLNRGFEVEVATSALAQAQGNLDAANADLARANAELTRLVSGPRAEEIAVYQSRLDQAHAEYLYVEDIHTELTENGIGGRPEERARLQSQSALGARNAAQAQLDLTRAGASPGAIAAARAMVSGATAQAAVADAGLTTAEIALNQAQAMSEDLTIFESQVQIAQGQLTQAEAQRDRLVNGATTEELAVLEAQLAQAEAGLAQAETAQNKTTLLAPFSGTVGAVYLRPGESVLPSQAVLSLGDLTTMRVETTDFNEVDAIQVAIGMPTALTFDALPGITVEGEVVQIAPMAASGQGGTNFTLIIEMQSAPSSLRWGMTAFVDIELD